MDLVWSSRSGASQPNCGCQRTLRVMLGNQSELLDLFGLPRRADVERPRGSVANAICKLLGISDTTYIR